MIGSVDHICSGFWNVQHSHHTHLHLMIDVKIFAIMLSLAYMYSALMLLTNRAKNKQISDVMVL